MKINKLLIASVLAVALLGCGKREPRHLVIMPDVSGSIDRESLEQAFKAIDELAGHLQRGDRLTIIPILGDAEAEVSGKVLRFEVPTNRQAYDTDLRDFRAKLRSSLKEMHANAVTRPGTKTDILGSVALAEQEFQIRTPDSKRLLVILSDLIQEDQAISFVSDTHLSSASAAKQLAIRTARNNATDLSGILVYLGLLQGSEFKSMRKEKRAAIRTFWVTYFEFRQARVFCSADGAGLLYQPQFLTGEREQL